MKMIKKLTAVIMTIVMLLTVMPLTGIDFTKASALEASGQLTDTISYTFDEATGTLTISGEGAMPNYDWDESPFYEDDSIKAVIIEDSVTSIGDNVFAWCDNLESIEIPDSVTSIGNYAFEDCSSLKSITIPDSVTSIGYYAFEYCTGLTSITIPDSVTSIGESAFEYCTGLTSITIPDSVTSIGIGVFRDCTKLASITVDENNSVYDSRDNCNAIIETATNTLFFGCKNTTIPDSVTSIGDYAFYGCESLTSITIPDSVTSIGERAFYYCLKDVYYGGTEEQWNKIEIGKDNKALLNANIHFTEPDDARVYLNDTVYYTFDEATGTLTISGGGAMPNYNWGESPFYEDDSIKAVIIEDSVTSIGWGAFSSCDSLTSIEIPDSVTSIGDKAFYDCDSLTSIEIPDSVTSIGDRAFYECSSLTSITIPDSVTSIGYRAFEYCTSLTSITVDENNPVYDSRNDCNAIIKTATNTLIAGCKNTIIPDSVTSIGNSIFSGCSSLTSITIPDSVTSIGWGAFSGCSGLTSITIPDSVTSIGDYAFCCTGLENITIPDSVTSIGYGTFEDCDSLTSITIPDSVTSIGESAFDYCYRLTDVYYGGTEEQWKIIKIRKDNEDLLYANIHYIDTPADYTAVFSAIDYANGLNPNDYTDESWTLLMEAINAVVYDLNYAHQNEVDAMATAINEAIDALDTIYYTPEPDFSEINGLLDEIAGLNEHDYTPESWANLERAVDAVMALYIGSITQPVVNDAVAALRAAIAALEKVHTHTLSHVVVPSTCAVQGMEYDICTDCGETMNQTVLPLAEHTWGEWIRTLDPTTQAEGVEERTCCVCGAVETKFIEKLNEIVDEETGVSITYGDEFTQGVELAVAEMFDGTSFQILSADYDGNIDFRMFDITPTFDGEKIQPTGTVTVRIPVPAEFNGTDIFVVYVNSENGTTEDLPCTVVDGYVEFQTTHFSHYAICQFINLVRRVRVSDISLKPDSSKMINPKITADDGVSYTVKYFSYDPSVADVDSDGTVHALKNGKTSIRCIVTDEYGNSESDVCKVTVRTPFIQWIIRIFFFGFLWMK